MVWESDICFLRIVTLLSVKYLLFPAQPVTSCPHSPLSPSHRVLLVVQQIIHVLSGQLHLANATLLSVPTAANNLCAGVKWTVNIDSETARGKQRPCQNEKESEGDGGEGDDKGMEGEGQEMERGRWSERERGRSCLLPRQLSVLWCTVAGNTLSPQRARGRAASTHTHHTEFSHYHHSLSFL